MPSMTFGAAWAGAVLLTFLVASAHATDWGSYGSSELIIFAEGEATSHQGAKLTIRSESDKGQGAAVTSIPANEYIGKTLEVEGHFSSDDSLAMTSLWMRIDGPDGRVGFTTSEGRFAVASTQPVRHSVSLGVPSNASRIIFGVALSGSGELQVSSLRLKASSSSSVVTYEELMQEAIVIFKQHAYYSARVDWTTAGRLPDNGSETLNIVDAHVDIARLIGELDDGHSMHVPRGEESLPASQVGDLGIRAEPSGDGLVAYLSLPSVRGSDPEVKDAYVDQVCASIAAGEARGIKRWIVDLRENTGGTMWPMLQGVKPLLGSQPGGYFVDRAGERQAWEIQGGCAGDAGLSKVAVLLGSKTASAGEAVAVAFSGRPRAKSFGQRTAGQANGNRSFDLSDGSLLLVMSSLYADRKGKIFSESFVDPDVHISDEDGLDAARLAAERWLRTQ